MRMEIENGELSLMLETDEEYTQVGDRVAAKYDAALEALLADIRPVFMKHGLDADDPHFIEYGLCDLVREKLWGPAKEEELLGGRF